MSGQKSKTIGEQLKQVMFREDGVDHLNADLSSPVFFGKTCSVGFRYQFSVPFLGEFSSARAFAAWMVTGVDGDRQNPPRGEIPNCDILEYHRLVLFGKFFQLKSRHLIIAENKHLLDLPWTSYRVIRESGIRQYNRWVGYHDAVKGMCKHILKSPIHGNFFSELFSEDVMETVNKFLRIQNERNDVEFKSFQMLEQIAAERANASREETVARNIARRQSQELDETILQATLASFKPNIYQASSFRRPEQVPAEEPKIVSDEKQETSGPVEDLESVNG